MAKTIAERYFGGSTGSASVQWVGMDPKRRCSMKAITPDGVYRLVRFYSTALGFEIGAHSLRATAATNALDHEAGRRIVRLSRLPTSAPFDLRAKSGSWLPLFSRFQPQRKQSAVTLPFRPFMSEPRPSQSRLHSSAGCRRKDRAAIVPGQQCVGDPQGQLITPMIRVYRHVPQLRRLRRKFLAASF